ncbi:hypothetical protein C8R44DRAFT_976544 [Mycena epipterygia]|nr:hypothetical protein C8R44DRAFT_976544 [Mycena epipterygia]
MPISCNHPASSRVRELALQSLIYALRNPYAPQQCGRYLIGCLHLLESEEGGIPKRFLKNHDFWNAAIQFLTIHRSKKQMNSLLDRLAVCPRQPAQIEGSPSARSSGRAPQTAIIRAPVDFHYIGECYESSFNTSHGISPCCQQHDEALESGRAFPVCLMLMVAKCMALTKKHVVARGNSEIWPTSLQDLMPFGADATVAALQHWRRIYPGLTSPFHLCGAYMRICQLLIVPQFAASPLVEDLVRVGRKLFDHAMTGFSAEDAHQRRHVAWGFSTQVLDIERLMTDLKDIPAGEFELKLLNGHETKIVQLCSLLLFATTDPRFIESGLTVPKLSSCAQIAAHYYRLYQMHLHKPFPVHPAITASDATSFPPLPRTLRDTAVQLLRELRAETLCLRIGCSNSLQSAGRAFQRCSRCNLVSYCSTACQATAWTAEACPHKRVCPKLRRLLAAGGGVEKLKDASSFTQNCLMAGVSEDWIQYVDEWWQTTDQRRVQRPDGSHWSPGFRDYAKIVGQFGADGNAPKALHKPPTFMFFNTRALLGLLSVAIMTTPCVAQLQITCFLGGPAGDCVQFAPTFCNSLANLPVSPGDTVSRCFNGPAAGSQCAFTAVNTLTSSGVPSVVDCESALFTVADECPVGGGGQSSGNNFKFWMDPNVGACPSPNGI